VTVGDRDFTVEEVVLIVDDDEDMRQGLVDLLSLEGVRSIEAGRADQALELSIIHNPAAVVVDYHLPDRSGIELAHTLKERSPDIPVLLLTGFASLSTAIAAVGRLDAYLIKPVAPQIFLQTVLNALTRRRLMAENRTLVDRLKQVNAYQALYDPLTALPNRALLDDRLAQALVRCQSAGAAMAVLFIDLDRFKDVNDLFGHQIGDHVLREMANRLTVSCRKGDSVARFGGDEFVVVCPEVGSSSDACHIAAQLLEKLAEPIMIEEAEHRITASVGIAVAEPSELQQSTETLLRNADTAMYQAKEAGRARWELFDKGMRDRVMERFEIERGLRNSLENGGLAVAYQRLVDVRTASTVGVEALVRWDRPGRGMMLPGSFLDIAEDSGLIVPIGTWVLDRALTDVALWRAAGITPVRFCLWVNVSPHQLANPNFPSLVHERLEAHGVDPQYLGIEILEESLVDFGATVKVLTELRAMGVSLNLDDFGAGYSNLRWLQELPITGLKIDRRFVSTLDLPGDDRGTAIVRGLISLGHSLGLNVVAEGVETEAQAAALDAMGCELAQGYYYGYPAPSEELWGTLGS
jgi:diguanylate cyclase (GGDEF)-like protein